MIEHIPLALSSLKTAKDIVTSLIELRDSDKIISATIELKGCLVQTYDHIISEKERVLSLQERISELEKECTRLKNWDAEKEEYTRRQVAPGVFTYIANEYVGPFENAHKLCCNCFSKTIPSTLQQSTGHNGQKRITILTCPNGCPRLEFGYYRD